MAFDKVLLLLGVLDVVVAGVQHGTIVGRAFHLRGLLVAVCVPVIIAAVVVRLHLERRT